MRIHLCFLAAASLAGTAATQSTNQFFELHGHQTSFTSRGTLGSAAEGELLQGFHASHHIGLAENDGNGTNRKCELTQLRVMTQDQNCATRETYRSIVRRGDDMTGPIGGTAGAGGLIFESGNLLLPMSNRNSACTWQVTATMTTPIALPCPTTTGTSISRNFFAMGVFLSRAPNWTMDGQSIHTSFGSAAFPDQNSWNEQVTTGFKEHAWQVTGSSTVATKPDNQRTWRVAWATHGVTMQLGCSGGYGMGGMFPRSSPATAPLAYTARLRGGSNMWKANSVAMLNIQTLPAGAPFGSGSHLYVVPTGAFFFFGPKADGGGQAIVPIATRIPPNINPTSARLPFQGALDMPSTGVRLSNAQFSEPK